jgi:2-amino-4-hydroxy-6-hydroxymethyldihydropteridine diphosphokinase
MEHTIYLALGTNLGDRLANLRRAREILPPEVLVTADSSIYETPPWGITDQPAFLNQVLQAGTDLAPLELLAHLKHIETQMGRKETVRYGPRLIDLDILIYDRLVLKAPGLTIPHPRLAERAFVLVPFNDLAPDLLHPVTGQTIRELLSQVDPEGIKRYGSAL